MTDTLTAPVEPVVPDTETPPPPQRRRRLPGLPPAWPLLLTSVLLFAAAIGFLVLIAADPTPNTAPRHAAAPRTSAPNSVAALVLPARINRYTAITVPGADIKLRAEIAVRSLPSNERSVVDRVIADAAFGAYGTDGKPVLSLVAFKRSAFTGLGIPSSTDPALIVQEFLLGTPLRGTRAYPPGVLGGALRCGSAKAGTTSISGCTWADAKSIGVLTSRATAVSVAQLAQLTNVARAQLEK